MRIILSPQRRDGSVTVSRDGETLVVNGSAFDLSQLRNGQTLPAIAFSEPLISSATRKQGRIVVTITKPHGPDATAQERQRREIDLDDSAETSEPGFIDWSMVEGDEPIPDPLRPLEPDQFWFVVRAAGYEQDIKVWLASMTDPLTSAFASAKLDFAKYYERHHPLIEAARVALGITEQELDDLWAWGHQ